MVSLPNPIETLGVGLYSPHEAARFARVRTEVLKRWLFGEDPVVSPRFPDSKIITFRDLIQIVAVRTLRDSDRGSKLTLQYIRKTVRAAEKQYGITYPLARDHTMYVYANRLILKLGEDQFVGLDPEIDKDQLYHHRIIEPFLTEVRFDNQMMAEQWSPLTSGKYRVSLDSSRRFGQPVIEPAGILVWPLTDAVQSEGSVDAAAEAFETETEAVRLALKYRYDYLSRAA